MTKALQYRRRRASIIVAVVKATCRSRDRVGPAAVEGGVAAVSLANRDRGPEKDSCFSCSRCCCCLCPRHRLQPGTGTIDRRLRSPPTDVWQLPQDPLQNWFVAGVGRNQPHGTPRHRTRTYCCCADYRYNTHMNHRYFKRSNPSWCSRLLIRLPPETRDAVEACQPTDGLGTASVVGKLRPVVKMV